MAIGKAETLLCTDFPVNYTDLYLYSTLSRSAVQQRLQSPLNMTILLIMGVFLLVFALTVFISIRLHLPFKKILKELDSPAWLMSNRVAISRDEEAFILDSIRKMSLKNEQITEELSQRVALLKQAQARCAAKPNQSSFFAQYAGQHQLDRHPADRRKKQSLCHAHKAGANS